MSDEATTTEDTEAEKAPDTETVEVPQDLSTVATAELAKIHEKVQARGRQLAGLVASGTELDGDGEAEAETVSQLDDEIANELSKRAEKQADMAAKLGARFATAAAADADKADDADADKADDADKASEAELSADDNADKADDADADKADDADRADASEAELAAKTPQKRRSFQGADMAQLASKSPAEKPKNVPGDIGADGAFDFSMTTDTGAKGGAGRVLESPAQVAAELHKSRMAFGQLPKGRSEQSIAIGTKAFRDEIPSLGLDPTENLKALNQLTQRGGLVASGAQCTPQTQLYDFFRLAEPIQDVENCIPTVQAPRGGIRYIQANCAIQGVGAVGIWGPSGIDPTEQGAEKPCDRVTCPSVAEVLVEAVTQCTIFDNLQYRTFPELIENFLEDVAVQFTLKKQRYYLDAIDTASTQTIGIGSYGAARSYLYDLTVAANAYRKRHHMPRGARLQVVAPDWVVDVLKADLFNDGDSGLNFMNIDDETVVAAMRSRNLDVCFYYDDPTSAIDSNGLIVAQAGSGAALNDYPCVASTYMYAPGTFVKLDGGSLDVGLVRDHSLNKTNDFAMFMEEWIGLAQLGCESVRIDSTVVPSGSRAPYAAALRTCTPYVASS